MTIIGWFTKHKYTFSKDGCFFVNGFYFGEGDLGDFKSSVKHREGLLAAGMTVMI